ncbi:MAG: hypothetical protein OXN87_05225 [Chloroflexota bacterium]|nr:hypothetical protein [Chloroflexota bacterium]
MGLHKTSGTGDSGSSPAYMDRQTAAAYDRYRETIVERDNTSALHQAFDLIKEGRPTTEILSETIRAHAPYTHVPYHQRIDSGIVRFVNNDHCLLSSRATLGLQNMVSEEMRHLPLSQTAWYVPTGLDIWNQLKGRMPGHYSRRTYDPEKYPDGPAPPAAHWDDQEPADYDGSLEEGLNDWLTLVQYGHVNEEYSLFLGLWEKFPERREELLAQMMFAGLIDVQDRMFWNRSYTTGHKSFRARSTIQLGRAIGWDNAHHVLYAGVPDIAVGPRWYSLFESACQIMMYHLEEEPPASSLNATQTSTRDQQLFKNQIPLSPPEAEGLIRSIIREPEESYIEDIVALLKAGRSPKSILDAIQIAAARVVLECGLPANFSMPQHGYEYTNMLGWFYENFDHPHKTKLLFIAANFINQCAHWVTNSKGNKTRGAATYFAGYSMDEDAPPMSQGKLLGELNDAMLALDTEQSVFWVENYLKQGYDDGPLVETLADGIAKQGNDPHNQEIGLCMLEDYRRTTSEMRNTLLLSAAHHTAGHMKYGDQYQSYRYFADAFDMQVEDGCLGETPLIENLADDVEAELLVSEPAKAD